MTIQSVENAAGLSRATCGWRLPGLELEAVWNYWRDVHSPAISRRAGIHVYRHVRWAPVDASLLAEIPGVTTTAPENAQLQWMSDITYRDEDDLARFYKSPADPQVVSKILGDIEMIVERSTTYLSLRPNISTLSDRRSEPRQGPPKTPYYGIFLRQRDEDGAFRAGVRDLAAQWSATEGVSRVRFSLFERPDMAADRGAGYPVKTHPPEQQYQALVEVETEREAVTRLLGKGKAAALLAAAAREAHAYPVAAAYTFVWDGVPTIAGLRGYPALQAIDALGAEHAVDGGLLEWMYGPVVHGACDDTGTPQPEQAKRPVAG
jgi:hypothetical protein